MISGVLDQWTDAKRQRSKDRTRSSYGSTVTNASTRATESGLCIATNDPAGHGGVQTVTRFLYETAKSEGFDPYLAYNEVASDQVRTVWDLLAGHWSVPVETQRRAGMDAASISRVLPKSVISNYVLNYFAWTDVMEDSIVFGAGGVCLPCLPAALAGQTYGCWIGTTITDEMDSQRVGMIPLQRLRYELIRPILHRYERLTLRRADLILAQSEYTKQRLEECHGISPDRVPVVPFPIDTARFEPADSDFTDEDSILFVGRLNDPRKNVPDLLRAFKRIITVKPDTKLILVGDRPKPMITDTVAELGLQDAVSFTGPLSDPVPYLQSASVFVLPSAQEGLGIAALEAMSCGVPVVSTRCGGPEEFVQNGETGYLVPVGDDRLLSDRILRLLTAEDRQKEMGEHARALVERRYAEQRVSEYIKRAINRLHHRGASRGSNRI